MDAKLKHLEFIQGVIDRLSTNSFLLKGWSVVLVSALFALSAQNSDVRFATLAYFPAIVLWGLDGYFLSTERSYRKHYDRVREMDPGNIDFSMNVGDITGGFLGWVRATLSKTLMPYHGVLLGAISLITLIQQ